MKRRSLIIVATLIPFIGLSAEEPQDIFNLFSYEKEQPIQLIAADTEDADDFFEEDFFETEETQTPVAKAPAKEQEITPVAQLPLKEEPQAEIPNLAKIPILVEAKPAAKIIDMTPAPAVIETAAQESAPLKHEEPATYKIITEKTNADKRHEIASANILFDRAEETQPKKSAAGFEISLAQVFAGSPIIYSLLLTLSVFALFICMYSLLTLRKNMLIPDSLVKNIRSKLLSNQYEEAQALCSENENFFCKIVASAIGTRQHGLPLMLETMKAEGKRATVGFWQRIGWLNDIAIAAPMVGLLGTVLGMFYAFYDLNRSRESVNMLFDGLGISVGTTVAGLLVAIIAMILHAIAKYRLVHVLANVENEAQAFANLIDSKRG